MPSDPSDPSTWPSAPVPGIGISTAPSVPAPSGPRGVHADPASSGWAATGGLRHGFASRPERLPEDAERPVRSVLVVCTGNVCRSPFAEMLLGHLVPGLAVASRGTFALQGSPMDEQMATELVRRGGDPSRFRSRQLAADDLGADLILTMSPQHLAHIRDERPAAMRRSGLLGHAGALADLVLPGRALTVADVDRWARMRRTDDGTVPDPFRRGAEAAARTASLIEASVDRLATVLHPSGSAA